MGGFGGVGSATAVGLKHWHKTLITIDADESDKLQLIKAVGGEIMVTDIVLVCVTNQHADWEEGTVIHEGASDEIFVESELNKDTFVNAKQHLSFNGDIYLEDGGYIYFTTTGAGSNPLDMMALIGYHKLDAGATVTGGDLV